MDIVSKIKKIVAKLCMAEKKCAGGDLPYNLPSSYLKGKNVFEKTVELGKKPEVVEEEEKERDKDMKGVEPDIIVEGNRDIDETAFDYYVELLKKGKNPKEALEQTMNTFYRNTSEVAVTEEKPGSEESVKERKIKEETVKEEVEKKESKRSDVKEATVDKFEKLVLLIRSCSDSQSERFSRLVRMLNDQTI